MELPQNSRISNFAQLYINIKQSYAFYFDDSGFFLALFYHIGYVSKKGCHRTALEFCKVRLPRGSEYRLK